MNFQSLGLVFFFLEIAFQHGIWMCSDLFILVAKFFLNNSMDCQALGEAAQGRGGVSSAGKVVDVVLRLWFSGGGWIW